MNKTCIKCNISKNISNFSKNKNQKDGYYYYCKSCNKNMIQEKDWYKNQYQNNKEYRRNWERNYYKNNINYKLASNLRCRINSILTKTRTYKNNKTLNYLGCNLNEYKNHLESMWGIDMDWSNHGILWEVDHIIPISKFDLSKEKNLYICFNFKNTQPLYKSYNRSKKDKII
jgi:hypothetical protein